MSERYAAQFMSTSMASADQACGARYSPSGPVCARVGGYATVVSRSASWQLVSSRGPKTPGQRRSTTTDHSLRPARPVNAVAKAQRQPKLLQWVIPGLTGAVLVVNARMGEQQRPAQVAGGLLGRLRPGRAA
jgi:hypothetical protein